jgi:hypothetical protein
MIRAMLSHLLIFEGTPDIFKQSDFFPYYKCCKPMNFDDFTLISAQNYLGNG